MFGKRKAYKTVRPGQALNNRFHILKHKNSRMRANFKIVTVLLTLLAVFSCADSSDQRLEKGFLNPPDSARPGVYWYFMDGNLSKESITKDLVSMKEAGIGYVVYLEVNVGVPAVKSISSARSGKICSAMPSSVSVSAYSSRWVPDRVVW